MRSLFELSWRGLVASYRRLRNPRMNTMQGDHDDNQGAATGGDEPAPLHPERLTWAVLLGRWVDFARSAVGLPVDEQGRALRESVADIIMLQAVWYALQQMQDLAESERALGLDRAHVLIDKHEAALRDRWKPELPAAMVELIADARRQLVEAGG